ncbi:MAG: PQQ-binding-like beta-propeller repeat protein, partial [Chloroflexota bacterium]|nr:PQQ-binding-like beta-propeller repeat protein [Chloroflexota bacterium]
MTWFARTPSRIESEALLDYWDDVIDRSPTTPVPPVQVPAEIGALVRTINNADTTNPDYPAYEDRLLQALLARQKEITHMNAITAPIAPITPSRPVRSPRAPRPKPPSITLRGRWIPALEIAMITFLLLASAAGIWLAGDRGDDPRIVAPSDGTPTVEATPDVPMYRGNPERTGQMPGPGPEGMPVERWRIELNGSIDSAPAVVDGVLYVGVGDGTVHAVDTATGNEVWTFATDSPILSSPAVVDGVVYIGSEDGPLYAIDASGGTELWTFPGAASNTSVAIVNDAVYASGVDGFLYALDAATGEEYWRAPLNETASRSPAVADGVVYIGSADGVLHTFDAATGEPGWALKLDGDGIIGTPALHEGMVYQNMFDGSVNYAFALDAATGDEIWRFDLPSGAGFLPPAAGNGMVYLPGFDSTVYALDAATGMEAWRFETGDEVSAAPALVGDTLYVAPRDGIVYALDAATGAERWRFTIDGEAVFGPTVTGGVAYVGTTFGYLYAIGGSGTAEAGALATPSDGATPISTAATPVTSMPEPPASPEAAADLAEFAWQSSGGDPLFAQPTDITIAPDGTIWIANGEHSQFDRFAPDGTFIESWGTFGDGDGEFNFVRPNSNDDAFGSVAFAPDGTFYVADMGNQRIQHFDADRHFLYAWGEFGPGNGDFLSPIDVAVDSQGNVFVDDDKREDIQKFAPDGTYLLTFGGSGSEPGQLDFPGWMTIDASDHVWVADTGNSRIQQWDNDGQFLAEFDGGGSLVEPWAVAIDEAGSIYVADFGAGQVVVLDATGAVVGAWGQSENGENALTHPVTITLDGRGNVHVIDVMDDDTWESRLVTYQLTTPLGPSESASTPTATPVAALVDLVWQSTGGLEPLQV